MIAYTVHDNGGDDTLDYSGFAANQVIDLHDETFFDVGGRVGNVIARGAVIEDAIGGSGNDALYGNAAANWLKGDGGLDYLAGGGGADRFAFAQGDLGRKATLSDTVVDFTQGADRLDFSRYDAVQNTPGIETLTFVDSDPFSGAAGELRFVARAGSTTAQGDTNGDGKADFILTRTGRVVLTEDDFNLSPLAEPLGAGKPAAVGAAHPWQNIELQHGLLLAPEVGSDHGWNTGHAVENGRWNDIHLHPDLV